MTCEIIINCKDHPHLFTLTDNLPFWSRATRKWVMTETPGCVVDAYCGWVAITFKTKEDGVKFSMFML